MNKTKMKIAILGIVALFAVLTVSTASAVPTLHFVPDPISIPEGYCNTTNVEVRINLSASDIKFSYGHFGFSLDPLCGNITNRTLNTDMMTGIDPSWSTWNWYTMEDDCWYSDNTFDWIVFSFWLPKTGPQDLLVGNFTIHCNSTEYCTNELNFGCIPGCTQVPPCIGMWDWYGTPLSYVLDHGTFECGTPAETYAINGTCDKEPDTVNITNLNTSVEYAANVNGYNYNLTLDVPSEVDVGNRLLIVACKQISTYESDCNVTIHTVMTAPGEETVDLTLNHYCKNYYPSYPFHTWNESNWSGPATMEMMIDHYRNPPHVPNQTVLNATGIGYNQAPCNANLSYVDPKGMQDTLNLYLHAYNGQPYVANYGVGSYSTIEDVLHYMCKWHYLGPGAAPAYGNYTNWMAVRGIHTDVKPTFTEGSYSIYGFWINDPNPIGIGENTYKTVDQWTSTYHLNLTDVRGCDNYKDKYVAVCEPPDDDDVEVTLVSSPARFNAEAVQAVQAAKVVQVQSQSVTGTGTGMGISAVKGMGAGMRVMAEVGDVVEEANRWIVQAAIDGANEQLVPYDAEFAAVFKDVVADNVILVTSDNGDYYLVPFGKNYEGSIEKLDAMIADLEAMKGELPAYGAAIQSSIAELESLRDDLNRDQSGTVVVVIVDAEDGHFKEASWVKEPVEYLPVTKKEALKMVGEPGASAELVYRDASPYYPDWKVTVGESVFFVSQDGTLSGMSAMLKATLENNVEVYSVIAEEFRGFHAGDAAEKLAYIAQEGLDAEIYNHPEKFVYTVYDFVDLEHEIGEDFYKHFGIINKTEIIELDEQLKALHVLIEDMKEVTVLNAVKVAKAQDDVTDVIQAMSDRTATLKATLENNVEVYSVISEDFRDFHAGDAAEKLAYIAQDGLNAEIYNHPEKFVYTVYDFIDLEHEICEDFCWKIGIITEGEAKELHEQLKALHALIDDMHMQEVTVLDAIKVAEAQDDVTDVIQAMSSRTETLKATLEKNADVYGKIFDKLYEDYGYESDAARKVVDIAEEKGLANKIYNHPREFIELIDYSIDGEHYVCDDLVEVEIITKEEAEELHAQLEALRYLIVEMPEEEFDAVKIAVAQDKFTEVMRTVSGV